MCEVRFLVSSEEEPVAKSNRQVARSALVLLFLLLPSFTFPAGSQAQAQAGAPGPEEMVIYPQAVVQVEELAPVAPAGERLGAEERVGRVVPRRIPDPEFLRQEKEKLRREGSGSRLAPETALQPESALKLAPSVGPTILTDFIGLRKSESGGFIPPDTQVAAGPNHLFEAVNTEGRILTKTGTVISTFSLNDFFLLPSSTFLTDPRIHFDRISERWFVSASTDEDTSGTWQLAVSMSDDPTAGFSIYTVTIIGAMPDFPSIGFNDDKVVLTGDAFACTTSCDGGFLGTMFLVINKVELLLGGTVHATFFPPDQGLFAIQPAHSLSSTTTLYMAAVQFNKAKKVRIWSLTGIPSGVPGGVTATTVDRPISTLKTPPDARQRGTTGLIATNDNALLDAVFRDGSLWLAANAACRPRGDKETRACLRFIQVLTGAMRIKQDFNFGNAGAYYYYPAIQTDSGNNLITVFSRSSSSEFASVYASGRLTTDPSNTLRNPVLIKAGEAAYGADRWGDYSGAAVDPSDPTKVWVAGEYARVEGGSEWGTWIAEIQLP